MNSSTSFTFTVTSNGYFDAAGSHITFSLSSRSGELYLSQNGDARNPNVFSTVGFDIGYIKYTWQQQANNLKTLLGVNPDEHILS